MNERTILWVGAILLVFIVGISFAQPVKPIILGTPQTMGFESGRACKQAIELAVEEINATGGVNVGGKKRPFEVKMMDSRDIEPGVPVSEVLLAVEKLILDNKADFIVSGPTRTEATLAMMDMLNKYRMVSVNSVSLSPALGSKISKEYDKYKYFFSITNWADWLVRELSVSILEIGKKFGINKVYIIVQDVAHARSGGEIMEKVLKEKGWEIAGRETYPTGTTDFSAGLLKTRAAGRCILFLWGEMPEFTILLKQWHDMKVQALPTGMVVAFSDPGLWKATEGKCAYVMSDVVNAGNVPSHCTPWTMKFVEAYKKKRGVEPEYHGVSQTYMVPHVLKNAIERAGTLDSDSIIKALEQTDMMGVYGKIKFDPKSHKLISSFNPEEGAIGTIFQWQGGKRVGIFPAAAATGEVKLPPWMK